MVWKRVKPITVPSLEKYSGALAKRFTDIKITKLVSNNRGWIKSKMHMLGINSAEKALEFVIKYIDYPFTHGALGDAVWRISGESY